MAGVSFLSPGADKMGRDGSWHSDRQRKPPGAPHPHSFSRSLPYVPLWVTCFHTQPSMQAVSSWHSVAKVATSAAWLSSFSQHCQLGVGAWDQEARRCGHIRDPSLGLTTFSSHPCLCSVLHARHCACIGSLGSHDTPGGRCHCYPHFQARLGGSERLRHCASVTQHSLRACAGAGTHTGLAARSPGGLPRSELGPRMFVEIWDWEA